MILHCSLSPSHKLMQHSPILNIRGCIPFCEHLLAPGFSCSEQGPLVTALCRLLTAVVPLVAGHRLQGSQASAALAHGLGCSTHVQSSWTRDRTSVPCIGRRILNYWTAREVSPFLFPGNYRDKFNFFNGYRTTVFHLVRALVVCRIGLF